MFVFFFFFFFFGFFFGEGIFLSDELGKEITCDVIMDVNVLSY